MKRLLSALLSAAMLLSCCSCSGEAEHSTEAGPSDEITTVYLSEQIELPEYFSPSELTAANGELLVNGTMIYTG